MKSTLKIYASVLTLIVFLAGCKKKVDSNVDLAGNDIQLADPKASFTASKLYMEQNTAVQFKNASENYEKISWDFGDGTTSTEENPIHSFTSKGSFKVTATAKNGSKIHQQTQTLFCGMKSFADVTISFSDWKITQEMITKKYTIVLRCLLYNNLNPDKIIKYLSEDYVSPLQPPSVKTITLTLPFEDEISKYRIDTYVDGIYSLPSNDTADYYQQVFFGKTNIENIDMFSLPRPTGSKLLEIAKVSYTVSEARFE